MSEKILVPVLGESITEATVAKWLKNVGEAIEMDEPVVELETDKVNLEVPSPISGIIEDIKYKDGDVVKVGAVLGSIKANGKSIEKEIEKIKPDIEKKDKKENLKIFQEEKNNAEDEDQP